MKRAFIAAVILSIITVFSSCGSLKKVSDNTVLETTAVTYEKLTTVSDTENETDAASETEKITGSSTEKSTALTADSEGESSVIETEYYSLKVDGNVWTDMSSYIDLVADMVDDQNLGGDNVTSDQVTELTDVMYVNKAYLSVNFNVNTMDLGMDFGEDFDMSAYGALLKGQIESVDGYTYLGGECVTVNGYNAYKSDIDYMSQYKMTQYIILKGSIQSTVTLTSDYDSYDEIINDFEEVLSSFTFNE